MTSAPAAPPWNYSAQMLDLKTMFGSQQAAALAEPFTGVRPSSGTVAGLFSIKATGVTTEPIRVAAEGFLAKLTPVQKLRTQFGIGDPEWQRWYNIDNGLSVRQGVSLKEMTPDQKTSAFALMRASLSARGFALTEAIRKTDQTLRELNDGEPWLDEDLYYFTVMGIPSPTEPWGWQLDGHHLIINYFVLGDQVVMTPSFFGTEPAVTRTGIYAGNAVLQDEQTAGLSLMQSLDADQRRRATIDSRKTGSSMKAGANADNLVLDYAGVRVGTLSPQQRAQVLALIDRFVGTMNEGHARVRMEEVAAHLDQTWFAWVGAATDDAVFYYRIHSPVILIEFDHQAPVGSTRINEPGRPTRDHIHTVIRTPNGNDYGKDLLGQHL
ncbi:MAG: DUF3500 domain-containing protein, partial [Acidobacteria bacterium]|nr:DUF3500 domain-containing protein [Acidobacteriota bacterium]